MESKVDFVIEDHIDLIKKIASYFKNKFNSMEYDDLFQVCAIGVMEASKDHDKSRDAKFSTFAYRVCTSKVYRYRRQTTWFSGTNDNKIFDIPTYLNTPIKDLDNNDIELIDLLQSDVDDFEKSDLIIFLQQSLDKREFGIMYRYYFQEWTNQDIAKKINLSENWTSKLRIAALEKIKESLVNGQKKSSLSYQN